MNSSAHHQQTNPPIYRQTQDAATMNDIFRVYEQAKRCTINHRVVVEIIVIIITITVL